jgi:hypothetical protein
VCEARLRVGCDGTILTFFFLSHVGSRFRQYLYIFEYEAQPSAPLWVILTLVLPTRVQMDPVFEKQENTVKIFFFHGWKGERQCE